MCIKGIEGITFCHCPYCKSSLIIIDNKVISCPVCELRSEKATGPIFGVDLRII